MLTLTAGSVRIAVRVQPRAARTRIAGRIGAALKVQISEPPQGGAANAALIAALAEWVGVPRRSVTLMRGARGRDKVVEITTAAPAPLAARIECLIAGLAE
ncbi:MAG: DUF167 domain-containing protein [Candidatus Binatia bacterium]